MKLLGQENVGGRIHKWWLHTDAYGNDAITVETVQDCEPVIQYVKQLNESYNPKSAFRHKATIPVTVLEEMCRVKAKEWGVRPVEAFKEIYAGKTNRAQKVMRTLTEGRDYRKLQAEKREARYV